MTMSNSAARSVVSGSALSDGTLAGPLRRWAADDPGGPALSSDGADRTWEQLYDRVCRVAQGLLAEGVGPGDRVVYLARNRAEFYEVAYAASMVGAVVSALNWRLSPAEVAQLLAHCEPVLLFAEPHLLAPLDAPAGSCRVVELGAGAGAAGFESWLSGFPAIDPQESFEPADPVLQMYTSGTTGLPKAALFSHAAVLAATAGARVTRTRRGSVVLVSIPVFHAAGGVMGFLSLSLGAHVVVSADTLPEQFVRQVKDYRVTTTVVVPTVLQMLVDSPVLDSADLSSLDCIGYAGAPMAPSLQEECLRRIPCHFAQLYGTTEIIGATGLEHADHVDDDHPQRRGSVGRPLPGVELRVVDPVTGLDRPDGVVGEVWARTATAMIGYWRDPGRTAETLTGDGFVRTGDAGRLVDGYLYLGDRIRDMIITGGENVFPTEVENVLLEHPAVVEAAVVGAPSRRWGETVRAVVVHRPGAGTTAEELIAFCRDRLAHFKCPTVVDFVDVLPRNASGKVLRRVLREDGATG